MTLNPHACTRTHAQGRGQESHGAPTDGGLGVCAERVCTRSCTCMTGEPPAPAVSEVPRNSCPRSPRVSGAPSQDTLEALNGPQGQSPELPSAPGAAAGVGAGWAACLEEGDNMGTGVRSTCRSPLLTCNPRLRAQHDHGEGDEVGRALCHGVPTSSAPGWHVLLVARQVGAHTPKATGGAAHPPHWVPELPRSWLACWDTHVLRAHGSSLLCIPGSRVLAEPQQPLP